MLHSVTLILMQYVPHDQPHRQWQHHDLDLQMAWRKEHSNNLSQKNCSKWDTNDPKKSLHDSREYSKYGSHVPT